MFKKVNYVANFAISFLLLPFFWRRKKNNRKNIWLFGAGNGCYENNIACFHEYIIQNLDLNKNEIYFVTTDRSLLCKKYDFPYLIRGEANTYAISFIADYLIFDTCNSDIAPGVHKYLHGLKVNVSHGFEGLKKLPSEYYANIDADIHCASSEKERYIKQSLCGANPEKVYVTGYPRFDRIGSHKNGNVKKILFFPTWRSWLEELSIDELKNSDYVKAVRSLLLDEKLRDYLKNNDIVLYYKPHHKLKHLNLNSLCSANVKCLDAADDLSFYICDSDLLITDYSSVTWDFLYNNRQVLFYVFDIDKYIRVQGLYYDVRTSKSKCYSLTTAGMVALVIQSCIEFTPRHSDMAADFFKFRDAKNCERLLNLIIESRL